MPEKNTVVVPDLPTMPLGQEVMTDYRTTGLSLKRHPVALVRDELAKRGVDVKFAIHPVAGHMPGHMNVLLA